MNPSSRLSQVRSHLSMRITSNLKAALASNGGGATSERPLLFYDLISKGEPKAWSPNAWKTRLLLNLKGIPYKTIWVSYADLKDNLIGSGFGPSAISRDGREHYTVPSISDPSKIPGEPPIQLTDSPIIVEYLDAKYPNPSGQTLFPPGSHASISLFIKYTQTNLLVHLIQLVVPLVHEILDERGADYFHRTRKPLFGGKDLKDVNTDPKEREVIWTRLWSELDTLASHYAKSGGQFWMGNEPTYPDVLLVALFIWMSRVKCDTARDGMQYATPWDVIKERNDGRWAGLMEFFEPFKSEH